MSLQLHRRPLLLPLVLFLGILLKTSCGRGTDSMSPASTSAEADSLQDLAAERYDSCIYAEAIHYNRQAMSLYRAVGDSMGVSDCYASIASACCMLGDVGRAVGALNHSLRIDSLANDTVRLSSDYSDLAGIYLSARDTRNARVFIMRAIQLEESLGQPRGLSTRYGLATEILGKEGEYEQAIDYGRRAYTLDSAAHDTVRMARRMAQMADAYRNKGDLDEADALYRAAIDLLTTHPSLSSLCICYKQLGMNHLAAKRKEEAAACFERSADIARNIWNTRILQEDLEQLAHLYASANPSRAVILMRESMALKEYFFRDQTNSLMGELAVKYDLDGKNRTIAEMAESLFVHKLLLSIVCLVFLLVIGFFVLFFYVKRLRMRSARILRKYAVALAHKEGDPAPPIEPLLDSSDDEEDSTTEADRAFILQLNQTIDDNIDNPALNSVLIAEHLCLSQRQLNRKVKAITGTDTTSYIREQRLHLAMRLLQQSDESISLIYTRCGFDDPSHFSRTFKKYVGCTPTDYRRQQRES